MSSYTPTPSYGLNYGAREQQNPPYLPPTYPNQYMQAADSHTSQGQMGNNYDASMNAYAYNRAIPSFSAAAVASGVPPLPIFQGWNQDAIPLPPYNLPPAVPAPAPQYNPYGNTPQNTGFYPPPPPPPPPQPTYQQNHIQKPFEPDLSEGEFEDGGRATRTPPVGQSSGFYRGNGGNGYVDTAHRAVYSKTQDYSPQQSYSAGNNYNYPSRDHSQTGRQESASYSPYAPSPGGLHTEQSNGFQAQNAYASIPAQEPANSTTKASYGKGKKIADSSPPRIKTNVSVPLQPSKVQQNSIIPIATAIPSKETSSTTNGKSVAESRKKAQGAILNLLPFAVGYQTYIEEGFKPDIIDRLFDDLKLSRTPSRVISGRNDFVEGSSSRPDEHASSNDSSKQFHHESEPTSRNGAQDSKACLSLRTNGHDLSANTISPTTPIESKVASSSAPVQSAEMTEKQRALELKKEALRKSREERAQKAAAKTLTVAPEKELELPLQAAQPTAVPADVAQLAPKSLSKSPSIPKVESQSQEVQQSASSNSISKQPSAPQPVPKVAVVPHASAIPGLFLVSAVPSSATLAQPIPAQDPQPTIQSNPRKRPVAADFDEPLPSIAPLKRPFGQSRQDSRADTLVINVTDDEDESDEEDVEMDLESQADGESPRQAAQQVSGSRITPIQGVPPIGNFLPQKPWTSPSFSSPASTPPLINQSSRAPVQVLQQKEIEIEEMKKRIAELESRKRAKQASNGAQTPQRPGSSVSDGKHAHQVNTTTNAKVDTSSAAQQAGDQGRIEREKRDAVVARDAEIKRIENEQRIKRKEAAAKIAEIEIEEQRRIANREKRRAEDAEDEAALARLAEDKKQQQLVLLESSEKQLQIEKNKLDDLETEVNGDPSVPSVSAHESVRSSPPAALQTSNVNSNQSPAGIQGTSVPTEPVILDNMVTEEPMDVEIAPVEPLTNGNTEDTIPEPNDEQPPEGSKYESHDVALADRALEAALQEAVRAEADSHVHTEDEMDMETSYAPDPEELAPESPASVAESAPQSPEYSPQLERSMADAPDRESDDYEPPEATPPIDARSRESTPFSPAPPATISDHVNEALLDVNSMQDHLEIADNIEEESLPIKNDTFHFPTIPEKHAEEEKDETQLYTPYESPLKYFHAYRFHPNFKDYVSGGLKSLTYSHRADANKEICHFELEGRCNDPGCNMQHFKDIGLPGALGSLKPAQTGLHFRIPSHDPLSYPKLTYRCIDDAILTALGSPDEFRGEQRDRFCIGLKEVLLGLRVRKIRDFDIIASEIIAHRTKFLGDDSKVLPLEGTTI